MAAALAAASASFAQGRSFGQIPGFDHDQAAARFLVQDVLQRLGDGIAHLAHAHDAPAAHQAEGAGLIRQPRRILAHGLAGQQGQAKRIVADTAQHGAGQGLAAFAHQPFIGTEQQYQRRSSPAGA